MIYNALERKRAREMSSFTALFQLNKKKHSKKLYLVQLTEKEIKIHANILRNENDDNVDEADDVPEASNNNSRRFIT